MSKKKIKDKILKVFASLGFTGLESGTTRFREGDEDGWPRPQPPPSSPGPVLVNSSHYQLLRALGKGSYGVVRAISFHHDPYNLYALKVLSKRKLVDKAVTYENIFMERHALARIHKLGGHPFIIKLYQTTQTSQHLFCILQVCLGGDLTFHLRRREFSSAEIKFFAIELLLALEYLHSDPVNIIHRDIKPNNILLTSQGHIKICDFGLSCFAASATLFAGTTQFAAPEMFVPVKYTNAVDLWSLGHTLFLLLCRRVFPFFFLFLFFSFFSLMKVGIDLFLLFSDDMARQWKAQGSSRRYP
jgi:serine/threonine protein kinase